MQPLILQDLRQLDAEGVIRHLAENYSGTESGFSYGEINDSNIKEANEKLEGLEVLVAYESVGSWGCDSSSYFLLKNKSNELFEIHGSHCSCYGFEGQLTLEPTTIKALQDRDEKGGVFYTGGYDDSEDENKKLVSDFIKGLSL
jgi:hypothetical protein